MFFIKNLYKGQYNDNMFHREKIHVNNLFDSGGMGSKFFYDHLATIFFLSFLASQILLLNSLISYSLLCFALFFFTFRHHLVKVKMSYCSNEKSKVRDEMRKINSNVDYDLVDKYYYYYCIKSNIDGLLIFMFAASFVINLFFNMLIEDHEFGLTLTISTLAIMIIYGLGELKYRKEGKYVG